MFSAIALPASLSARLSAIRWRIRLLRTAQGLALLVIVLGLLAAAAMLVDCVVDLPAQVRRVLFSTWLAIGIAWLLRRVLVPLFWQIDAAALAAVIEQKYPELGERLSTAVELANASSEAHGSPLLIALLMEEAVVRSDALDLRSAAPARRVAVIAVVAAATVLLFTAPASLWPPQYGQMARRFFRPWNVASAAAPAESPATHTATPGTPVELVADSPTITIFPPAYARSVKAEETVHGLVDLAPLQYSEMRFDFRFSRPVVAGYVEWITSFPGRERQQSEKGILVLYPLTLSADRQAATLSIPAFEEVKYSLTLVTEHDAHTEFTGGTIHVQLDQPPSVRHFNSKEQMRSVLPDERIAFEIETADDIGVAGIELEYRVNDGKAVRQPLKVEGASTPSALGRHVLELAGKVHADDHFSYRFHIRDNLPKEYKGPHVVVYPPDGWRTVRIARRRDLLQEQEILAQRDEINRRLNAIRESLLQEKHGVSQVQQEVPSQKSLPPDCLDSIQQLQQENRINQKALREVAQLAEASTGSTQVSPLQPVADMAREVAEQEMHKSQQALDQAPQEPAREGQVRQLNSADQQLGSALKRLEELKRINDRLAQERLDRIKLEMLAEREKNLAEKTAELPAQQPLADPKARALAEKIKGEQAKLAGDLERLAERNEALKQALEQTRAEQAQQLADRALELAQSQRDLMKAQDDTERKLMGNRFAELARKQLELAKQQEALAQKTRSTAAVAPLKPEDGQQAVADLNQGKPEEAISHQMQAANELDRLAEDLKQAAQSPPDSKKGAAQTQQLKAQSEQARELAHRQRELRDEVQRAAQKRVSERPKVSEDPIEELSHQQKEVAEQIAELARKIGKEQGEEAAVTQQAQQAGQTATEAARQLETGTLPQTRQEGQKTVEQLRQLATQLARTPRRGDWQAFDPLLRARQLWQQQLEINRRLQPLLGNAGALLAHQRTQQRYLQQETRELSQRFRHLAQGARSSPLLESALQRAAANSQQAQQAMQQARDQGQRDETPAEKQAQERAAQLLEQASQAASEGAGSQTASTKEGQSEKSDRAKAGEAAVKAGQQMAQAQGQLNRGEGAQAQAAMQQAARELKQAAQHLAALPSISQRQQGMPGQPGGLGHQAGGLPDLSAFGLDNAAYAGKSWGELPSELRTKIVQDMKARYGEDYARMIKSYFESIADTKKP